MVTCWVMMGMKSHATNNTLIFFVVNNESVEGDNHV